MSGSAAQAEGSGSSSFLLKFAAFKGSTTFLPNQSFLLHVLWEAPSAAAAEELLAGLRTCAAATRRDTPCVPTYFFRVSPSFSDVCSARPLVLADHPHIAQVTARAAAAAAAAAAAVAMTATFSTHTIASFSPFSILIYLRLTANLAWAFPLPPSARSCPSAACRLTSSTSSPPTSFRPIYRRSLSWWSLLKCARLSRTRPLPCFFQPTLSCPSCFRLSSQIP
jgi:hypothetical protein